MFFSQPGSGAFFRQPQGTTTLAHTSPLLWEPNPDPSSEWSSWPHRKNMGLDHRKE